jgi:uncharacterized protein (DUF1015 family)
LQAQVSGVVYICRHQFLFSMANISPFKALRPQAQFAKQVASRPYDVLSSKEAKVEAQGNPASFLHITKSEIDLPENIDTHSQQVYEKAKENLDAFISRDILFQENKDCYYIYELVMNGRSQTGLVCCSSIDDYENGVIKKHEFTRPDKELDRITHIKTTGAQTGNVFLAYKDNAAINSIITSWKKDRSPVYDFVADDGIRHILWIINDQKAIDKISTIFTNNINCTYIADGHHRAASASKVRGMTGKDNKEGNYFLTTLFQASELKIMDYNRVIKDLNGLTADALLQKLAECFEVSKADEKVTPSKAHEFGMYLNKQWYRLQAKQEILNDSDPIETLDVSVLDKHVLKPIFNIQDQRTDQRIDFVGGIRGLEELEKRVDSGEWALAFSIYPVSIEQLFKVADSGEVMPPKSTWFEPKLRDGLLTHLIG